MPSCPLCSPGTKVNYTELSLKAHITGKHVTGQKCGLCQKSFKMNAALIQHLATKYHYQCAAPKCPQKFMTRTELNIHTPTHIVESRDPPRAVPITPVTFPCASCDMRYDSPEALQRHMSVVHVPKYPCPSCHQILSSPGALDEHESASHPSFTCSSCPQKFSELEDLLAHGRRGHSGSSSDVSGGTTTSHHASSSSSRASPKVQSCSMCKQSFSSVGKLSSHIKTAHPLKKAKKIHSCPSCDRTFSKAQKLSTHKITAHPPGPVCSICRLACPSQQVLNDHVAAVHPTCTDCNLGFEDGAAYEMHRRVSHPEPPRPISPPASHFCPFCDGAFKSPQSLGDHRAAKHPFTCGMCTFACQEEELLQEHIGSTHSCPVCHEGIFANEDLLNEHLMDHITPYRCEICQTRYAEEEDLHQHYRDSPDDVHPSCARCNLSFHDATEYDNHTEAIHPQVSCQSCDGALFDPGELSTHYLTSRNHPVCDSCHTGFGDRTEFAMHGSMEHPEAYCHLCQWLFESAEALQNHIRHFVAHPKCMDCDLRFADADAYQHHLLVVHRPHIGSAVAQDFDVNHLNNNEKGVSHSEERTLNPLTPDRVDPTWGFSGNSDFTYASFVPLPPSTSGYSSPLSQRVPTRSSVGSRSSSRTLSPPLFSPVKEETTYVVHQFGSPEFEHSPLSNVPTVGTPLASRDLRSPFSPRSETPTFIPQSRQVNGASHSDQESLPSAKSPETTSPVIKLPSHGTSPVSSSGWSTLSGEAASKTSETDNPQNHQPADPVVPMLRLQVPVTNGSSHTAASFSVSPSDISSEPGGIDISANVTPDYLREARAYLAVTHPGQAPSTANHVPNPVMVSPSLSSIEFTASSSRGRRREVRFDDSIMSEPMWDNHLSDSSDSSFDPPVMQSRRKYGVPKRSAASRLPRFAPLRTRVTGRNGYIRSAPGTSSLSPYHCRICRRETCEDLTTTTCGHLFCNACITDAVIQDSRCPVCSNAVLLYCLFRIDTACDN